MLLLAGSEVLKVLLLSTLVSSQQYVKAPPQYQVQDNGEKVHSPASPIDYTAYLSGGAPTQAQATEEKGFVEPIDFSGLFAGASSGITALAPSSSTVKDFFTAANSDRDPFSSVIGSATSQFPSEVEVLAEQNNGTGFTNPQVKFQSLFDISGSASEAGFRPQDFLQPKKKANEEEQQSSEDADTYSPSYDYKPYYPKPAAAAPNYHSGSKDHTLYRASPSEERSTHSSENYNDQTNYKPKYTESYAANPSKYHKNKYVSEIAPGKSSYPAPSSPETYKPLSSEVRPEKANIKDGAYGGYSSYAPPNIEYSSDGSATQQGKSIFPSPASAFGVKSSTSNASPNEKNNYAPAPSDLYKQFGIEVPQPSTINQVSPDSFGNTAVPQFPKVPSASFGIYPSVSTTHGSYIPNEQGQSYGKIAAATQPKEATATENQEKKCKKVAKHVSSDDIVKGRFRREAMFCFVCEDPKTKLSYEKCSYEPEPQGSNYFKGHTQSYKVNLARAPGFRFRRDLEKIVFDIEKEWDLETEKIYPRKVRQQSGAGYGYDSKHGYKYGPEFFGPYFEDKYTSPAEYSPSVSAPDPKNCKKVEKDKMTCYECTDPKNGGTSEQCSYSAKPKDKNYFIAHETSYNKDNKPKTERNRRGFNSKGDGIGEASSRTPREEPVSEYKYKGDKSNTPASSEEDKSYSPSEFSVATERKENKKPGYSYEPYVYSGPDYYSSKDKSSEGSGRVELYFEPSRSYDEYFRRLFPELAEAEKTPASSDDSEKYAKPVTKFGPPTSSESKSEHLKSAPPGFFTNNENKKDLAKVLGEFSKKDWSTCKKVIRDKMTCYQCVDKKGLQHEECMFVAASEPKNQHLAYHEVKEFRLVPPSNDNQSASASDTQPKTSPSNDSISSPSNLSEETASLPCALASSKALPSTLTPAITTKPKRKTFFKKVTTTTTSAPTDSKVDETQQRHIKKTRLRAGDKSPTVNVRLARRTSQSVTSARRASPTSPPPTALLEEQPTRRLVRRKVTMSTTDMVESASSVNGKKQARPKSQAPLPSEPELSERDRSPDGYYSAETRTRFDPVLKVTLPEYMLTRSEHEAIFDEVMASGRKH